MTTSRRFSLWVSCLLAFSAPAGFAQSDLVQQPSGSPPPHLALIEGRAFIDREGRSDPATENLPLLDGDRLRTTDGRLEVVLPDGSLLHVDRDTTVDVMAADLLRLLHGRVYVIVRGARDPQRAVRYQVDAPVASVQTGGPGEFRVWAAETASGREVELAVFRGRATIASSAAAEEVRAGERSLVRDGLAPSAPQYFNSARWDEFDRWSAARRDERLGTASAQYLPSELAVYASTFDQYGTWRYDATDGAVWYPTVAVDWRPYSVGYWRTYPTWGAFWVGGDPWGWPTHHYGYWGFSFSFGWYWRPATVWGPAWVHWAYSPGYVSWCPLGRHGYPVFGHFGMRGHYYGNHVDPWRGWTVMPRRHYGTPTPVHRVAIDGHRLDPAARGGFTPGRPAESQARAIPRPAAGGLALPRNTAGGGASGPAGTPGRAVPRPGSFAAGAGDGGTGVPRPADGTRVTPGVRTRLSPDEAARVLAGSGARTSGTATRRTFPGAPAFGSVGQRTDAPAATPDVTAFDRRRGPASALPRAEARPDAPSQFRDGFPAGLEGRTPTPMGGASRAPSDSRAPSMFGNSTRSRAYPRAAPSPDTRSSAGPFTARPRGEAQAPSSGLGTGRSDWSPPPAVRQNPYFRGGTSDGGVAERRAFPRGPEGSTQPVPRGNPSARGNGGGASAPSSPRATPYMRGGGDGMPAPSARPRDGGGGPPAGSFMRGGSGGTSAQPSPPRYNPGSGTSQPRGGGSSPPPSRRRGGDPD